MKLILKKDKFMKALNDFALWAFWQGLNFLDSLRIGTLKIH